MEREARMTARQAWVLILASVGSFMISLDSQVVAAALTTIRRDLGASVETLQWTVNAYNLSFAVLLLTGAAVGDRWGRRRMFAAGLLLFTAASIGCALAPSAELLIVARAVQGAGAALVMPLALTLVSAAFPPRRRGRALGLSAGVAGLAVFTGPSIGGAITQGLAWEWIFWLNVPIGVIAAVLALTRIEESSGPDARLDLGGVVLGTLGALGLVGGLVRGGAAGWGSAEVIGALAAGAIGVVAFVVWEGRAAAPMLPIRLFRARAFAGASVASFCLFGSLYGTLFFFTQYLQTAQGLTPLEAGVRMMPWTGCLMICAPVAGALADRFGERAFLVAGLALQVAGMAWLALIASPGLPYPELLPPLIVAGCGISFAMPAAQRAAMGAVELGEMGKASGAVSSLRMLGAVFGVAILTTVFAVTGSFASAASFTAGFVPAIGAAAGLALAGAVAGLAVGGPSRRIVR